MKIFFIWPAPGSETRALMAKLKDIGYEIVYWVCDPEDVGSRSDIILHNHFDAWEAIPAPALKTTSEDFPPPSRSVIESLYRTESLVMTMMNKGFDGYPIDQRKSMYYEMVRYWMGVLDLYKPEAIVMPAVPHSSYVYVLYSLAKMRNLKIVMFENSWVSDRVMVYHDYEIGSQSLLLAQEKNKGKKFSVNDLSEDIKAYYSWQTNRTADHTPIYMKFQNRMRLFSRFLPIQGIVTSFKNHTFWVNVVRSVRKRLGPNLEREYSRVSRPVDWQKKFIYFPLSVQPERTSSPQSDVFVNQILVAKILSLAVGDKYEVWVKEHPSQWVLRTGTGYNDARYKGYYEELSKIKNIRIVPILESSHKLMEKAIAVALIAGTAGFEAALRYKPLINFGLPWYRDFPGTFKVNSVESTQKALEKIESGFKVTDEMLLSYLKSFDEGSTHAYFENFLDKISKLTKEENTNSILKLISDGLKGKI